MVFSIDVLEHIYRDSLGYTVGKMKQLLKPGGISVHQIGLDDHLSHYAPGMPSKNYLKYSDLVWKLLYDNRSQHINRVQLPEFLDFFQMNNLDLLHCETEEDSGLLARITPYSKYQRFDERSLRAIRASLVHRKPEQ